MKRRLSLVLAASMLVWLQPAPAEAVTVEVSADLDLGFRPDPVRIPQGGSVRWINGEIPPSLTMHSSVQNAPLSKWSSPDLDPGETYTVAIGWAGTYPYRCGLHPASMRGTVRVPIRVAPTSGTVDTIFTLTLATEAAPTGFVYDVQRRVGTGAWTNFRMGVTSRTTTFDPTTTGTFSFRSRLRRVMDGAASRYSPGKTVTVT